MNDKEMDQIEAKARAEAYKPATERLLEEKMKPRTEGVIVDADWVPGPVNLWDPLVRKTGRQVEVLEYDPSKAGGPSDGGDDNPDIVPEDPNEVIASLPKGTYRKDDGKYYRMKDETVDELAIPNFMVQDEYDRFAKEYRAKHGRDYDREVGVIRARWKSGNIDREAAKNLVYALRYRRDVQLAKDTAAEYYRAHPEEMKGKADNVYAMVDSAWKNFYVDTSRIGLEVARGRRAELLDQMNREAKADPLSVKFRNMTLAKRFGFGARVEFEPEYEVNPDANLAKNYRKGSSGYWAAAKRTAQSVVDEVNAKGADASPNDVARRNNAMRALSRDSRYRDADANDFDGLDPLVPAKRLKRMNRRATGQYNDPQARDRLSRMLFRVPSAVDDLVSLYMEGIQ